MLGLLDAHWDYSFDVGNEFCYSDEDMQWGPERMQVLPCVIHVHGGRAVSAAKPIDLAEYFAGLPALPRQAREVAEAPRAVTRPSVQAAFVQQHPWALEFLVAARDNVRPGQAHLDEERIVEDQYENDDEEADPLGEIDALFAAMEKAKSAVGEDDLVLFRTRPLMGKWTLLNTGVVCDAYQCRAVGLEAVAFCQLFQIQQPLRFSTNLYGSEGALVCCRYWCLKLSFCYRLWLDAGASGFPFSDEVLGTWREPEEFARLIGDNRTAAAQARFAWLRSLRPLRPLA
jgi:hypothetical protein